MINLNNLLIQLVNIEAPSGTEIYINSTMKEILSQYCDEVEHDNLGNVIGLKKGSKGESSIMLAAHIDEIGLIVTQIDERGFIRFSKIGGIDPRILPTQEVIIHGHKKIPGVIGNKPPHIQEPEERKKVIKIDDMFIDIGLSFEEVNKYVRIGDFITFKRKPRELLNGNFSSNALDDRAGVATILVALDELKNLQLASDVYAVTTVQEEVGVRGATVSSFSINPDIGIAIDVDHGEMPGVSEDETYKLGKGSVISIGPNIHPKVFDKLKEIAEEFKMPYQVNPEPAASGTDAWAIQITRKGIPTAVVSIPLRYMHTTVETINLADIKTTGRLLAFFIAAIDKEFVEELKCY